MSTIHYDSTEFATIAKVLVTRCHWSAEAACETLEIISLVNTMAYNIRYPNDKTKAEPSTSEQIESALKSARVSVKSAAATVRMLPYNCDGLLDTAPRLEAMSNVQSAMLGALIEETRAS